MDAYIDQYTDFMTRICHKSENTVESYRRDVLQYLTYLKELGITSIKKTTKTTVLSYLVALKKKGTAASTMSRALASLRSFYLYLLQNGDVDSDPTVSLMTPPVEKKPPTVLTNREVELLMEQPRLTDSKGIRDKAMLEVLYATGIRVSELIGLDIDDVNVGMGFVRCVKSRSERTVPMGHKAAEALGAYLEKSRGNLVKDESERALFVNCSGGRMSRQGFWKVIKQYQHSAGIDKEITPHSLRHSFAAHLVENGADLQSIKEMMGHADISSTQVYAYYVDEKLRKVYEHAHPRA